MLDDFPRQKLRTLILEYGPALTEDARRCRALLLDYCGSYPREINVLIKALEEGIPASLRALTSCSALPTALRIAQLTQQLMDMWMLEEVAAQWAVETWALALDVIQPTDVAGPKRDGVPLKEENAQQENRIRRKTELPRVRCAPPFKSTPFHRPEENTDSRKLIVVVMIVGLLLTCVSTMNTLSHTETRPTIDAQALAAQTTASAETLRRLLSGPATPAYQLALHAPDGQIHCTDDGITLNLTWSLSNTEKLDVHYRYEVYSGDTGEIAKQRVAEGLVAAPAISVTLPCEPYAHYSWRVSASNMVAEWSKVGYFTVRCQERLCKVTSW